jgi:alginate O-acetyltransferase complex protein AlgI
MLFTFYRYFYLKKNRTYIDIVAKDKYLPSLKEMFLILFTFGLTVFSWIFFRANNISHAFSYIKGIFSKSIFSIPEIRPTNVIFLILFFILIEWLGREGDYALSKIDKLNKRTFRWSFYLFICVLIFLYQGKEQQFIYFQF